MNERRLDYDRSLGRLRELGFLGADERPSMPDHVPQPEDDEPLGLSFFRTFVGEEANLSNLSITRTFFGRSEIKGASFQNTDLTESNLCWNDFIDVDFSDAILASTDMRSSVYTRVKFMRSDLRCADMRHANFEDCEFDAALMDGTVLTRLQAARLRLSDTQKRAIEWREDDGPEPSGG
jgi:uncharacterized protein YjbI with pentapeptide repeats